MWCRHMELPGARLPGRQLATLGAEEGGWVLGLNFVRFPDKHAKLVGVKELLCDTIYVPSDLVPSMTGEQGAGRDLVTDKEPPKGWLGAWEAATTAT